MGAWGQRPVERGIATQVEAVEERGAVGGEGVEAMRLRIRGGD